MNTVVSKSDRSDAWTDVLLAATVFAVAPFALGGVVIRGRPGPTRDRLVAWIHAQLPSSAPSFRIPLHIGDDRLLGGIALAETLHSGRVVFERGLLAQCDHGIAIVAMAERIEPRVAAQLCAVLDRGQLAIERDGLSAVVSCESGLIVFDEGVDDERIPDSLRDRLALEVDLDGLDPRACPQPPACDDELAPVRARLGAITIEAPALEALLRGALRVGITSVRAGIHAARVARIH
ncbi:MAG: magnesium chelatase ATPase subunit D, partial [Deltaproteobacteria bacterium]|nr:magnesium chelatase ATPase subunit D [Nannocystaceae bacterium]